MVLRPFEARHPLVLGAMPAGQRLGGVDVVAVGDLDAVGIAVVHGDDARPARSERGQQQRGGVARSHLRTVPIPPFPGNLFAGRGASPRIAGMALLPQPLGTRPRARAPARKAAPPPDDGVLYAPQGLAEGLRALSGEAVFQAIAARAGEPRFRRRRNGFATLLHIILEQQVSIDVAAAMHRRLVGLCEPLAPETFLALDDATLRSCGFSRQKMGYARGLAEAVRQGHLDFDRLEQADDEAAFAELVALKGIGRWSAEIYLIFALGRADVWPAADLGLQLAVGECLGLDGRVAEPRLREIGEAWRPWRSVAACLFWQSYLHKRGRAAPVLPAELYA